MKTLAMKRFAPVAASLAVSAVFLLAGCGNNTNPFPQDNKPPTVELSSELSLVRAGLALPFTADASDPDGPGDLAEYRWNFGDGTTVRKGQDLSEVAHAFAGAGTYTVTVTVEDSFGNTASDSVVIEVVVDTGEPGMTFEEITLLGLVDDPGVSEVTVNGTTTVDVNSGSFERSFPLAASHADFVTTGTDLGGNSDTRTVTATW